MKAIEQYFHVVLFIMLHKVVQTFNSVDETLVYAQTNEILLNEKLPTQPRFKSFQQKSSQVRALQKLQNSIQTLIILWLVYKVYFR